MVFKGNSQKGLLVSDYRVSPYCPRCGTGLSDHELALGYETITDQSIYIKFPVLDGQLAKEIQKSFPFGLDDHSLDHHQ